MTLPLVGNIQLLYYRSDLYKKLGLEEDVEKLN
jgi:ABC-type glycerol-3-phosphate transport system substrate-binding protein